MLKYYKKGISLDKILPAYNDPLFSILIIVIMVLIVAVFSYVMESYKEKKQDKSLKNFLGKISKEPNDFDIKKIPFETTLVHPLSLLADTFTTQGDYQKSISIYLYLIENIRSFAQKEFLLENLGKAYLKAGFLKRSESIFLEILHKHARNAEALYYLEIVYELLNEYERASETLKPLQILGDPCLALERHLQLSKLLKNHQIDTLKRAKTVQALLDTPNHSYRRIMQELFKLNPSLAWQSIDTKQIGSILDTLWFLPTSNLNFDIISSNEILSAIYLAKGFLQHKEETPKSGIFAIDTIISAQKGGYYEVDLSFSYGCSRCKQHFPISFIRCPQCYAIDSITIKEKVVKKYSKIGYSLL